MGRVGCYSILHKRYLNFLEIARGQPNVGAAFGARWLCESRPTRVVVSLETLSASGRNSYLPAAPCCLATPLTVKVATFNRRPSDRLGRSYQSKMLRKATKSASDDARESR